MRSPSRSTCVTLYLTITLPTASLAQPAFQAQSVLSNSNGEANGERRGASAASIGDLNSDGVPDYVVGSTGEANGAIAEAGAARVISGRDGATLVIVKGTSNNDRLGRVVSGGGDIDADGFPDFATGSFTGHVGSTQRGMVVAVSGRTGAVLFSAYGDSANDWMGFAVACGGDLDGDGFADVAASAPEDDNVGASSGSVRVFRGPSGSPLFTLNGSGSSDQYGRSLAILGDLNGDARADFAASRATGSGSVRVSSGATGATLFQINGTAPVEQLGRSIAGLTDVNLDSIPDLIVGNGQNVVKVYSGAGGSLLDAFAGGIAGDFFGSAVSGLGDFDGDGEADFAIGAPRADDLALDAGVVYVYSGATGAVLQTYFGTGVGQEFGTAVAGIGDLNGDGRGDFVAGAPGHDGAFTDSGRSRVFVGLPATCPNLTTSVDFNVDGVPDACQTCQSNIAAGGPGNMKQHVCGDSLTVAGSDAILGISQGTPNGLCVLLASTSHSPNPAFGGTIWPIPVQVMLTFTLDAEGNFRLPLVGGTNGPIHVYLQSIAPWVGGPMPYEISPATHLVLGY